MGTPTRTAVTLFLASLEEETGALIAAAANSRYASRARDLSRPGVSWPCPRQGVRNLYGFVRFVYGFCTVLHGKVRIEVPGKQDYGGPEVSSPLLNHDVASQRVRQARVRRIQVLWRETGAKPAKVKSGALNSGGGQESGRGSGQAERCPRGVGVHRRVRMPCRGLKVGRAAGCPPLTSAPSMTPGVTLHVMTDEPLAKLRSDGTFVQVGLGRFRPGQGSPPEYHGVLDKRHDKESGHLSRSLSSCASNFSCHPCPAFQACHRRTAPHWRAPSWPRRSSTSRRRGAS